MLFRKSARHSLSESVCEPEPLSGRSQSRQTARSGIVWGLKRSALISFYVHKKMYALFVNQQHKHFAPPALNSRESLGTTPVERFTPKTLAYLPQKPERILERHHVQSGTSRGRRYGFLYHSKGQ